MEQDQRSEMNETRSNVPSHQDVSNKDKTRGTEIPRPSTVACESRRKDVFVWTKPSELDRASLSATARLEAAIAMEGEVKEKDKLIKALAGQLRKANEEKYKLVVELSGFRGPDRARLYQDNIILKERLKKVTRENLMLRGLDRKHRNTRIDLLTREKSACTLTDLDRRDKNTIIRSK